jgi:glycosyltransferase involved in cell wall biosynthesis
MTMPRVSVQVMVFNSALYLPQCVDSLRRQTFTDFEVLLLDAGSTDASPQICADIEKKDKRFRHLRYEEKLSIGHARVEALAKSRGEYIAVLDSDDWAHPQRLEKQVRWLERNLRYVLLASYYRIVSSAGFPMRLWPIHFQNDIEIRWRITFGNCLTHSSVMFRRAKAQAMGGYNGDLPTGEDIDFYGRLLSHGEFYVLNEPLVYYRTHAASLSNTEPAESKEKFSSIVKNTIQQQLGISVNQAVAAAVYNQSNRPAESEAVARESLTLLDNAYMQFRDHRAAVAMDRKLLGRTFFLHALQFMTKNERMPWWPTLEPVWRDIIRRATTQSPNYDWRRDPGLFVFHLKALLKSSPRGMFLALN